MLNIKDEVMVVNPCLGYEFTYEKEALIVDITDKNTEPLYKLLFKDYETQVKASNLGNGFIIKELRKI